jgi:hypothetical protein
MAYRVPTAESNDHAALKAHRDRLYQRLEAGYSRIEAAVSSDGEDTISDEWTEFWVALLREYERVCDELTRDLSA